MYDIEFTQTALQDLRYFRKYEQNIVLDAIQTQLTYEPTLETENRFRRDPPEISEWELRIGKYRVLYNADSTVMIVRIERIGSKPNNTLSFQGQPWLGSPRRRNP
ncbi:type II toxin-antitoxin system RelE/ParE family toxin [Trichothermofontia sichuanensis B231]|uniref:type II toxin-antitoxin system RelE family toxin n=1 Tax=Trichothermofontia sichuanensis TaxID=3045816 RepID=UPI0022454A6A|nr:type II toxin-antitoxin system RelE/ParE family toxin [Trichothermofontia sichuanensis]UZQ53398.1 type II toxin-antitoxin system RelE/ParE family toxin [Trichothermofontia sichuanensis B231]